MRRLFSAVIMLSVGLTAWHVQPVRAEPIHDAARHGDAAEVKRVLALDPSLANLVDTEAKNNSVTPLHYAAEKGHKAVAQVLLAAGADIDARGSMGTALELAVFLGNTDVAELLLDKCARLDIFTASGLGRTGDIVRLLAKDKTLLDAEDADGQMALHWAAYTGQKGAAELLLAKGAKIDPQKSKRGTWVWSGTPLHYAAWAGRKEVAALLLGNNADVDARDDHGQTPLHIAAHNDDKAVAELLIAHKADVNARENRVYFNPIGAFYPSTFISISGTRIISGTRGPPLTTPLHLAAENGSVDLVKLLLANRADVNARNSDRDTPLSVTKSEAVGDLLRAAGGKE